MVFLQPKRVAGVLKFGYVYEGRSSSKVSQFSIYLKNHSPQEAEHVVISQRNHPVDIHIFHNAHATIAWPQQTLL